MLRGIVNNVDAIGAPRAFSYLDRGTRNYLTCSEALSYYYNISLCYNMHLCCNCVLLDVCM